MTSRPITTIAGCLWHSHTRLAKQRNPATTASCVSTWSTAINHGGEKFLRSKRASPTCALRSNRPWPSSLGAACTTGCSRHQPPPGRQQRSLSKGCAPKDANNMQGPIDGVLMVRPEMITVKDPETSGLRLGRQVGGQLGRCFHGNLQCELRSVNNAINCSYIQLASPTARPLTCHPSTFPPRKAPRQPRSAATVAAILQAATRVLSRESLAGFNTNRVAEVAGVSVGSLYQ